MINFLESMSADAQAVQVSNRYSFFSSTILVLFLMVRIALVRNINMILNDLKNSEKYLESLLHTKYELEKRLFQHNKRTAVPGVLHSSVVQFVSHEPRQRISQISCWSTSVFFILTQFATELKVMCVIGKCSTMNKHPQSLSLKFYNF